MAGPAAVNEQRVTQTVEVADGFGGDLVFPGQGDADALGAAADGPGGVEFGVEARAAGQNEGAEGGKGFVHLVDFALELGDVGFGDAGLFGVDVGGEGGEDGAQVEEFMLDAAENGEEASGFGALAVGDLGEAV